jgi:carbon storage regulator
MLVLSRKESQRIKLGDSIVVTVVRLSGDTVRLGIEAPSDLLVLRAELEKRGPVDSIHIDDDYSDDQAALPAVPAA